MLGNRHIFPGGYRVITPQPNQPIFGHVWMDDVRTFVYVKTGIWVDPLHDVVKHDTVIEDKINKVFYMSENSAHQLMLKIETPKNFPFYG